MTHLSPAVLDAYLDAALAQEEQRAVAAHLAQCAACRDALESQAALFVALADLPLDDLPADLRPVVLAALAPLPFERRDWMLLALQALLAGAALLWLLVSERLAIPAINDWLRQAWRSLELERLRLIGVNITDWAAALPGLLSAFTPDLIAGLTLMQLVGGVALALLFWLVGNRALLHEQKRRGQQEVHS